MNINHKVTFWTFGKILNNHCMAIHKRTGSTKLHTVLCDMCTVSVYHAWTKQWTNSAHAHMVDHLYVWQHTYIRSYPQMSRQYTVHMTQHKLLVWCMYGLCSPCIDHAWTKQWTNSTHSHRSRTGRHVVNSSLSLDVCTSRLIRMNQPCTYNNTLYICEVQ